LPWFTMHKWNIKESIRKKKTCSFFVVLSFLLGIYSGGISQNHQTSVVSQNYSTLDSASVLSYRSPRGAALRSLFVPGWGQWYNKKYWKSGFVALAETALLAEIINYHNKFKDTHNVHYRDKRNTLQWWLTVTILFSVADSYVDAFLDRFNEQMEISSSVLSGNQLVLHFSFQINL